VTSEVSLDHGELKHGQEVDGSFFVACGDSSGLLEPADAALHDVAARICFGVEGRGAPSLATEGFVFFRNDRLDASLPQPMANARNVVAFVACQASRTSSWTTDRLNNANRINSLLEGRRFVDLTGGYMNC